MIRAVHCDKPTFRSVMFEPGLNVILSERTKESTEKGSRNGLGKTTLLEIIHFCLGSGAEKGKGVLVEPLLGWTFFLEVDFGGHRYTISRNTENPGRVLIEGDSSFWPIQPQTDKEADRRSMKINEWNAVLGWLVFDLPTTREGKPALSFRSLISYFIRRGRDAFGTPFEHHRKQSESDKQINNAFLLGLSWEYAQKWQHLREREIALTRLREASRSGVLVDMLGTIGELETIKVRLEEELTRKKEQLSNFRVHPQYREIELEANALTEHIHHLTNENVGDRRMVTFYQSSFADEEPASADLIARVYQEAGILLPNQVVRRLEDVLDFHRRVVVNRKKFLQAEIHRLEEAIADRERQIAVLADKRSGLLSILQTHGALEEHNNLQRRYTEAVSELAEVKKRIENLRRFEEGKSALRIDREKLFLRACADFEERRILRQKAISLFQANSEALYDTPGKLIIDVTPMGYRYDVQIQRSASQGFEQMKVFCYDLMLAELWAAKAVSPGFLIHDSTIFDNVDERQFASALRLAAAKARRFNFQYICCLNSDTVPWKEFGEDFNLRESVCLELTDARENGGLLGIRF